MSQIATELEMGGRRKIQGSEGFNDLLKTYLNQLYSEVAQTFMGYIEARFNGISQNVQETMSVAHNPFSKEIQNELILRTHVYVVELKEDCQGRIMGILEAKKNTPYAGDHTLLSKRLFRNILTKGITSAVNRIHAQRNVATFVSDVLVNMDPFINSIVDDEFNDQSLYTFNAQCATYLGQEIWNEDTRNIISLIISEVESYDRAIEEHLQRQIMSVESSDFTESEDIVTKRQHLLRIENHCCKIRDISIG